MNFEGTPKNADRTVETEETEAPERQTPERLRLGCDKIIGAFCKDFQVEGKAALVKELADDPDQKFVIASSHLSNLDAAAAIKAVGDVLDIQVTSESLNFGFTPQELMMRAGGKENFTSLQYRKNKGGAKSGVFDPDNFRELSEKVKKGKTPWMAVHPFTNKEELQPARIGSAYLAQKTGARVIPAALEVKSGGSISLDGLLELAKAGRSKLSVDYHIGRPIDLEPLDVSVIESVLDKRKNGVKPTKEEREEFAQAHKKLKEQADLIARAIAGMLPEDQKGQY